MLKVLTQSLLGTDRTREYLMAAKVIDDAEKIANKVHESAKALADKVAENTTISSDAALEAKTAYTEANSQNNKIAELSKQVLMIAEHIKSQATIQEQQAQAQEKDRLFNERVKVAIDEKLEEMNGHATRKLQTRKTR